MAKSYVVLDSALIDARGNMRLKNEVVPEVELNADRIPRLVEIGGIREATPEETAVRKVEVEQGPNLEEQIKIKEDEIANLKAQIKQRDEARKARAESEKQKADAKAKAEAEAKKTQPTK